MIKDVLSRIDARLDALGITEARAGILAGLSDSTIRNIRRSVKADKPAGISTKTLAKLAPILRTTEAWLLNGDEDQAVTATESGSAMVAPPEKLGMINVIGKVAANNWLDVDRMDFDYSDMFQVPTMGGYPASQQFALVVDGNCLNRIAAHGDILVCLDIFSAEVEPQIDDLVIVERRRFSGQMVERTAKRLKRSANGLELWPESVDPSHQNPISLEPAENNTDIEIQIIGKVLWILRKP